MSVLKQSKILPGSNLSSSSTGKTEIAAIRCIGANEEESKGKTSKSQISSPKTQANSSTISSLSNYLTIGAFVRRNAKTQAEDSTTSFESSKYGGLFGNYDSEVSQYCKQVSHTKSNISGQ